MHRFQEGLQLLGLSPTENSASQKKLLSLEKWGSWEEVVEVEMFRHKSKVNNLGKKYQKFLCILEKVMISYLEIWFIGFIISHHLYILCRPFGSKAIKQDLHSAAPQLHPIGFSQLHWPWPSISQKAHECSTVKPTARAPPAHRCLRVLVSSVASSCWQGQWQQLELVKMTDRPDEYTDPGVPV